MKTEEEKTEKLVQVSESGLLALVAAKLKARVLFPEKVKSARKYIKQVTISTL